MFFKKHKERFSGSIWVTIGFILSPLSWWNDLYVNVPIAYGLAWLVSFLYRPAFLHAFIAFYWATNLWGFILIHKGMGKIIQNNNARKISARRSLAKDIIISIVYTGLIILLVKLEIIKPVDEYIDMFR